MTDVCIFLFIVSDDAQPGSTGASDTHESHQQASDNERI